MNTITPLDQGESCNIGGRRVPGCPTELNDRRAESKPAEGAAENEDKPYELGGAKNEEGPSRLSAAMCGTRPCSPLRENKTTKNF